MACGHLMMQPKESLLMCCITVGVCVYVTDKERDREMCI